jgi:hypothetical protein
MGFWHAYITKYITTERWHIKITRCNNYLARWIDDSTHNDTNTNTCRICATLSIHGILAVAWAICTDSGENVLLIELCHGVFVDWCWSNQSYTWDFTGELCIALNIDILIEYIYWWLTAKHDNVTHVNVKCWKQFAAEAELHTEVWIK